MKESKSGILAVSKRTLLLVAGLVWGIAGFRVFTLGEGDVSSYNYKYSYFFYNIFYIL